jgi:hypothetical protein
MPSAEETFWLEAYRRASHEFHRARSSSALEADSLAIRLTAIRSLREAQIELDEALEQWKAALQASPERRARPDAVVRVSVSKP